MKMTPSARQIAHSPIMPVRVLNISTFDRLSGNTAFASEIIGRYRVSGETDLPSVDFVYQEMAAQEAAEGITELSTLITTINNIRYNVNILNQSYMQRYYLTLQSRCEMLIEQLESNIQAAGAISRYKEIYREVTSDSYMPQESRIFDGHMRDEAAWAGVSNRTLRRDVRASDSAETENLSAEPPHPASGRLTQQIPMIRNMRFASQWTSESARQFFWRVQRASEPERDIILQSAGTSSIVELGNRLRDMTEIRFRSFLRDLSGTVTARMESIASDAAQEERHRLGLYAAASDGHTETEENAASDEIAAKGKKSEGAEILRLIRENESDLYSGREAVLDYLKENSAAIDENGGTERNVSGANKEDSSPEPPKSSVAGEVRISKPSSADEAGEKRDDSENGEKKSSGAGRGGSTLRQALADLRAARDNRSIAESISRIVRDMPAGQWTQMIDGLRDEAASHPEAARLLNVLYLRREEENAAGNVHLRHAEGNAAGNVHLRHAEGNDAENVHLGHAEGNTAEHEGASDAGAKAYDDVRDDMEMERGTASAGSSDRLGASAESADVTKAAGSSGRTEASAEAADITKAAGSSDKTGAAAEAAGIRMSAQKAALIELLSSADADNIGIILGIEKRILQSEIFGGMDVSEEISEIERLEAAPELVYKTSVGEASRQPDDSGEEPTNRSQEHEPDKAADIQPAHNGEGVINNRSIAESISRIVLDMPAGQWTQMLDGLRDEEASYPEAARLLNVYLRRAEENVAGNVHLRHAEGNAAGNPHLRHAEENTAEHEGASDAGAKAYGDIRDDMEMERGTASAGSSDRLEASAESTDVIKAAGSSDRTEATAESTDITKAAGSSGRTEAAAEAAGIRMSAQKAALIELLSSADADNISIILGIEKRILQSEIFDGMDVSEEISEIERLEAAPELVYKASAGEASRQPDDGGEEAAESAVRHERSPGLVYKTSAGEASRQSADSVEEPAKPAVRYGSTNADDHGIYPSEVSAAPGSKETALHRPGGDFDEGETGTAESIARELERLSPQEWELFTERLSIRENEKRANEQDYPRELPGRLTAGYPRLHMSEKAETGAVLREVLEADRQSDESDGEGTLQQPEMMHIIRDNQPVADGIAQSILDMAPGQWAEFKAKLTQIASDDPRAGDIVEQCFERAERLNVTREETEADSSGRTTASNVRMSSEKAAFLEMFSDIKSSDIPVMLSIEKDILQSSIFAGVDVSEELSRIDQLEKTPELALIYRKDNEADTAENPMEAAGQKRAAGSNGIETTEARVHENIAGIITDALQDMHEELDVRRYVYAGERNIYRSNYNRLMLREMSSEAARNAAVSASSDALASGRMTGTAPSESLTDRRMSDSATSAQRAAGTAQSVLEILRGSRVGINEASGLAGALGEGARSSAGTIYTAGVGGRVGVRGSVTGASGIAGADGVPGANGTDGAGGAPGASGANADMEYIMQSARDPEYDDYQIPNIVINAPSVRASQEEDEAGRRVSEETIQRTETTVKDINFITRTQSTQERAMHTAQTDLKNAMDTLSRHQTEIDKLKISEKRFAGYADRMTNASIRGDVMRDIAARLRMERLRSGM